MAEPVIEMALEDGTPWSDGTVVDVSAVHLPASRVKLREVGDPSAAGAAAVEIRDGHSLWGSIQRRARGGRLQNALAVGRYVLVPRYRTQTDGALTLDCVLAVSKGRRWDASLRRP